MTDIATSIILQGLLFGLCGSALVLFVFRAGQLGDFWPALVNRLTGSRKLHKVLYDCEACISGQMALWLTPLLSGPDPVTWPLIVLTAVFAGGFISSIHEHLTHE